MVLTLKLSLENISKYKLVALISLFLISISLIFKQLLPFLFFFLILFNFYYFYLYKITGNKKIFLLSSISILSLSLFIVISDIFLILYLSKSLDVSTWLEKISPILTLLLFISLTFWVLLSLHLKTTLKSEDAFLKYFWLVNLSLIFVITIPIFFLILLFVDEEKIKEFNNNYY